LGGKTPLAKKFLNFLGALKEKIQVYIFSYKKYTPSQKNTPSPQKYTNPVDTPLRYTKN